MTIVHAAVPEDEIQHVLAGFYELPVTESILGGDPDPAVVWSQVVKDQHHTRHLWNILVK